MRSVLTYTAARLLLFAVALGVVYLLGARGYLALLIALVASALVSYVLLSPQRDALSRQVVEWGARIRSVGRRLDAGAGKEDPGPESPAEPGGTTETAPRPDTGTPGREDGAR